MVKKLRGEAIAITSYLKNEVVNVKFADGESLTPNYFFLSSVATGKKDTFTLHW